MHWTNAQAARELHVSERQVTRWRGGQEPRLAAVREWARVFGREVTWFFDEIAPESDRSAAA